MGSEHGESKKFESLTEGDAAVKERVMFSVVQFQHLTARTVCSFLSFSAEFECRIFIRSGCKRVGMT